MGADKKPDGPGWWWVRFTETSQRTIINVFEHTDGSLMFTTTGRGRYFFVANQPFVFVERVPNPGEWVSKEEYDKFVDQADYLQGRLNY